MGMTYDDASKLKAILLKEQEKKTLNNQETQFKQDIMDIYGNQYSILETIYQEHASLRPEVGQDDIKNIIQKEVIENRYTSEDKPNAILELYQEMYSKEPFYHAEKLDDGSVKLSFETLEQRDAFHQKLADQKIDFDAYDEQGNLVATARNGQLYDSLEKLNQAGHNPIKNIAPHAKKESDEKSESLEERRSFGNR